MMKRMDKGLPPDPKSYIDPATGTVMSTAGDGGSGSISIKNGTSRDGLAAKAAEIIADLGFLTTIGNADSSDYKKTIIVYNDENMQEAAEKIRDAIGCGEIMKNDGQYSFTSSILVVLGADFS